MILVTAPTGDIGKRVLSGLINSGEAIRLVVRDASKLSDEIRSRVDVVEGAHSNRAVIEKAFDGADKLFWLVPSDSTAESAEAAYVDFSRPAAEALKSSTITHVVSISALGRGWASSAGHASASIRMDDLMAATGVNYATMACSSLMSNIARQTELIKTQCMFFYPATPDIKLPHVAAQDVATLSVKMLLESNWEGFQEIPMMGPEDLSFAEMAATISDVLGKTVTFHEMTMADMKGLMIQYGGTEGMAQAMIDMLAAKNEGMDHLVSRTAAINVNTPTTFRQWCETDLRPSVDA